MFNAKEFQSVLSNISVAFSDASYKESAERTGSKIRDRPKVRSDQASLSPGVNFSNAFKLIQTNCDNVGMKQRFR